MSITLPECARINLYSYTWIKINCKISPFESLIFFYTETCFAIISSKPLQALTWILIYISKAFWHGAKQQHKSIKGYQIYLFASNIRNVQSIQGMYTILHKLVCLYVCPFLACIHKLLPIIWIKIYLNYSFKHTKIACRCI